MNHHTYLSTFSLTIFYGLFTGMLMSCSNDARNELDKSTRQLAIFRGFEAIDHSVITEDGYILNLVQAYNPLIDKLKLTSRTPVLFIHGFLNNGNTWLVNSMGAKPQDYSEICPTADEQQLLKLAKQDPGFNSVPITFMNCGREVWILNRRGTKQSVGHIGKDLQPYSSPIGSVLQTLFGGLPSMSEMLSGFSYLWPTFGSSNKATTVAHKFNKPFNPRYWNFSLDEEAKHDVHNVIDYVLEQTGKSKLTIVAHSSGATITLMAQVLQPELADKTYSVPYLGSFTPQFMLDKIRIFIRTVCRIKITRSTICSLLLQSLAGPDGFTEPLLPGYAEGFIDITSSHELAHLVQASLTGRTHHFDYFNPIRNQIAYGQPYPPVYNVSRVLPQAIGVWYGNSDAMVPAAGIRKLIKDLRSHVHVHYIGKFGVLWSHFSYFFHQNKIPSLLTVPSVIYLESREALDK